MALLLGACESTSESAATGQLDWSSVAASEATWTEARLVDAPPEEDADLWQGLASVERTDRFRQTSALTWFVARRTLTAGERGRTTTGYLDLRGRARVFVDRREVAIVEPLASGESADGPFSTVRRFEFTWPDASHATLHVLYAEFYPDGLEWLEPTGGFRLLTGSSAVTEAAHLHDQRTSARLQTLFMAQFATQALVHLLLFLFYPRIRSNLWFSITSALSAVLVALQFQRPLLERLDALEPLHQLWNVTFFLTMTMLLRFSHEVFDRPMRAVAWLASAGAVVGIVISLVQPNFAAFTAFWPWILLVLFLCVRAALQAWREGWGGAWILLIGFALLTLGLTTQQALAAGLFTNAPQPVFPAAYFGVAGLLVMTSAYLAFHFARAIGRLRVQITQIEELSQQNLEQQLAAMEQATEQRLLEADNQRKTVELDEARNLQLALLPRELPQLDDLEIAVSMDTATEVGGDFYDFYFDAECGLTVAVGDAAGHGARAGSMVSLMKGLFSNFGPQGGVAEELPELLERTNRQVRELGIRRLQMALTVVRACGHELTVSAAGMPPALLWRADTKTVEELELAGLPLGALDQSRYRQLHCDWQGGDLLLLMSDGLPEMQRDDGSVVGYEEVRQRFASLAHLPPEQLIDGLRTFTQRCSNGLLADDVTFVVVRNRADGSVTHHHI